MPDLSRIFHADLRKRWFSAIAVATAALYFFSIFHFEFLIHGDLWATGHGDIGLNFLGFLYFVRDHWRFPLFHTQNLGYPDGSNIILTDSTPLLALITKLFRPLLPEHFNPFGLWILACYLLLAHAFSSLIYHFGRRGAGAAVSSALLAVMTSYFSVLLVIASLEAQFIIVYAILLYFKVADSNGKEDSEGSDESNDSDDKADPRRPLAWFLLLLIVALLIEFYLFAMAAVLYGCALVNSYFRGGRPMRRAFANLALALPALIAAMFVAGYLPGKVPWTGSSGFGHFSMNLLAPFTPARAAPVGPLWLLHMTLANDATGGQYEGFNYWGAGVFLMLAATAPWWLRRTGAVFTPRIWPLAAGLVLLTAAALSNQIYFGKHLVFSYPLPKILLSLGDQFHSGGRFFWVVSYCVAAFALLEALRLRPARLSAALIVVALGAQFADTQTIRTALRRLSSSTEPQSITEERWRPLVAAHREVALIPPAQCGGFADLYSEIGGIGARAGVPGVPINSVRLGRYTPSAPQSCRSLERDIIERGFEPGVLYIVDPSVLRSIRMRPQLARYCTSLESRYVCTAQREALGLPPLEGEWRPPLWLPDAQLRDAGQLAGMMGAGWSEVVSGAAWSLGDFSELLFRVPDCSQHYDLRIHLWPFGAPGGDTISLSANGGEEIVRHYQSRIDDEVALPISGCNASDSSIVVSFRSQPALSPLETGESGDPRPMGLLLLGGTLSRDMARPPEETGVARAESVPPRARPKAQR